MHFIVILHVHSSAEAPVIAHSRRSDFKMARICLSMSNNQRSVKLSRSSLLARFTVINFDECTVTRESNH
eukprot:6182624-Pleurochrysis_carterae.AAC.1